jgi:hypothetical protein
MGISIKNEDVEQELRDFAKARDLSLTAAIERALRDAKLWEESQRKKTASAAERSVNWQKFLEAARQSQMKSDRDWSRDELHDR